jgi:hypothetical protein
MWRSCLSSQAGPISLGAMKSPAISLDDVNSTGNRRQMPAAVTGSFRLLTTYSRAGEGRGVQVMPNCCAPWSCYIFFAPIRLC